MLMVVLFVAAIIAIIFILSRPMQQAEEPKARQYHSTVLDEPGVFSIPIAGINYRDGIGRYVGEFECVLMPEPENKNDPNAITIRHTDGKLLGYVPSLETISLHSQLRGQWPYHTVASITREDDHYLGLIYLSFPQSDSQTTDK